MAKKIGGKAARIALAAVGAATLSAVGTGAVTFVKWAKDPYSKELWFGFLKKGILITKTEEPHHYRVQTGYKWHDDDSEEGEACCEEPEMEITLPADALDPLQDEPAPDEIAHAVTEAAVDAAAAITANGEAAEAGNEA